ncbi:DUF3846 domain-containing protein [Nonomuraea basaltis]|uniref:DUF3846 domain-containing protein n=1 Tax=Nonomuraea basaltis TaxID=2495887 RepID=UPI00110C460F|nr:DUF3846 domain-containing protein [Nonomuraea basaltis]TMR92553.1 DUF3846 domain-containing protein [Nonomuraea basaltis]
MSASILLLPNQQMRCINLPANACTVPLTLDLLNCFSAERHQLAPGVGMWIDSCGQGLGREVNMPATKLSVRLGGLWIPWYGPVLVCGIDEQGRSHDLTADQLRHLAPYLLGLS